MADIVLSSKRKINIFDRVIQSVVIMVNMNKMNKAIDEHLQVVRKCERDDQKKYQENVLREIVFVKYQYDIMQRQMYELKLSYPDDIIDNINSTDKTQRLDLQKIFLEMEYDRITKAKFRSKEDIKYGLVIISSTIDEVKQNIKDEGKNQRYNNLTKVAEDIDSKIDLNEYTDDMYTHFFEVVNDYVEYLNDNYDISKLPTDERELIEYVIEVMIKGVESDIDKHLYEFNLTINICKSAYRYFKIIDKVFDKIQKIYDESFEKDIISLSDYIKMYKEIYDNKIKTMVNDVHRTIKTEDEYFEYSKLASSEAEDKDEKLDKFILNKAYETTTYDNVKDRIKAELKLEDEEEEIEEDSESIDEVEESESKKKTNNKKKSAVKDSKKVKKTTKKKAETKDKTKKERILKVVENVNTNRKYKAKV